MLHLPRARAHVFALLVVSGAAASPLVAQSCLGYPALPTGQLSVSAEVTVGSDFWGLGTDVNYGRGKTGPFAAVGVGTRRFVSDPKETRYAFGGSVGWERYNRDQLIWCPFFSAAVERGNEVQGSLGPQTTSGTVLGVGLGIGFELERRGPLSFNPYLMVRQTQVRTNIDRTAAADSEFKESGAVFAFGLGVRFNEAIQVTPTFSGGTFEGSNLVFDLRTSVALKFR